eukprot:16450810-Heterocapsa_arctica.AAC.1
MGHALRAGPYGVKRTQLVIRAPGFGPARGALPSWGAIMPTGVIYAEKAGSPTGCGCAGWCASAGGVRP